MDRPPPLRTVELHQGVAVVVCLRSISAGEISANHVPAALPSGFVCRIKAGISIRAPFLDLRFHQQQRVERWFHHIVDSYRYIRTEWIRALERIRRVER